MLAGPPNQHRVRLRIIPQFRRPLRPRMHSQPDRSHAPDWWCSHELFFWNGNRAWATFQTPHPETRIRSVYSRDGIGLMARWWLALVAHSPAFGAGNSAFNVSGLSPIGCGRVREQFRLHLSLETPIDRRRQRSVRTAATACPVTTQRRGADRWECAVFDFPASHITTHAYVDLAVSGAECPAVFDWAALESELAPLGCSAETRNGSGRDPKKT